jgi:hypothetical protein
MAIRTKLELWLPDRNSLWGRLLPLSPLRRVPISVPEGFSFGTIEGCFDLPKSAVDIQTGRWLKVADQRA